MFYHSLLIKYAEIGIKGKNRHIFEDQLVRRIVQVLRPVEGRFLVSKATGRIYVKADGDYDFDGAVEAVGKVFGVAEICPLVMLEDTGFENLKTDVVAYMKELYEGKPFTFKVFTRRARKSYPMDSNEINAALGEAVLDAFPLARVDVHEPQVSVHVEIRDETINLYTQSFPGPGGMPVGSNGKGMLLLSGGIDSPVAGWMCAKRGVALEAVYFHAPPYTSERAKQKVVDLAKTVSAWSGPIRLHVIDFTAIQLYIYETCPHEELTILMRRSMMRIAERLARADGCLALITGESIGQVASQTVQSLAVTNEVCTLPVFRPVIAFDKQEIVDIALKIGTYETSILPFEDCCTIFVAKHPVTKPNLNVIKGSETLLGKIAAMEEAAAAGEEIIDVD